MSDHKRAALDAATKAVAGCNVKWDGAIDTPEIVALAALQAAAPHLYAAERERQAVAEFNQRMEDQDRASRAYAKEPGF